MLIASIPVFFFALWLTVSVITQGWSMTVTYAVHHSSMKSCKLFNHYGVLLMIAAWTIFYALRVYA